jgi:hypothetical protein
VLRSLNYYPIGDELAEEGIASLALGLGKYIVDGGQTLRVSPYHPRQVLQTSEMDTALRETQTRFYALDMSHVGDDFKVDDGFNILNLRVKEADKDQSLNGIASTYDPTDQIIRDGIYEGGRKVISFCGVLQHGIFPLPEILQQSSHAIVRDPYVHRLVRILHTHVGAPDELQQFGQCVIVIIKLQLRVVLLFGPLRQEIGTIHIKETVAQIGYPGTVDVIVGGFGITGKKTLQGWVVTAVTIQHILAGIKNGKHKRFAPHAMGLHKFIGITETGLQRFQAGSALAGTHPFVPFLG